VKVLKITVLVVITLVLIGGCAELARSAALCCRVG
jgi:hypothetical protein